MRKRVLITYFKNGDIKNEINKQLMYETAINKFILEGKKKIAQSEMHDSLKTTFSDGSTIEVVPLGTKLVGGHYTHIYADTTTIALGYTSLLQLNLFSKGVEGWDLSGSQLNIYTVEDGRLKIHKEEY